MKKTLIILVLILTCTQLFSQVLISLLLGDKLNSDGIEFGLDGGLNYTNIVGFESTSFEPSFQLGFYFDIRIKNQYSFSTGVAIKSNIGLDELTTEDLAYLIPDVEIREVGTYKQRISQFAVPLLLRYKLKNYFFVEAGPELSLNTRGWVGYTYSEENIDEDISYYNSDLLNTLNAGGTMGLGYQLRKGEGMSLAVRYHRGFTNVFHANKGTHLNALQFKFFVPIGNASEEE